MRVTRIARQASADFLGLRAFGKNRHAVPPGLAVPDGAITYLPQRLGLKALIGRLQFLKTSDVRRFPREPFDSADKRLEMPFTVNVAIFTALSIPQDRAFRPAASDIGR